MKIVLLGIVCLTMHLCKEKKENKLLRVIAKECPVKKIGVKSRYECKHSVED